MRALAAAVIGVSMAFPLAAPAQATPWSDEDWFLQQLAEHGFSNDYGDAQSLRIGYRVCDRYYQGWSDVAVMDEVAKHNPALGVPQVAEFVAISQWALCPQVLPSPLREEAIARGTLNYAY